MTRKYTELEAECAVTIVSRNNAKLLTERHGIPEQLDFHADVKRGDYTVTATWRNVSTEDPSWTVVTEHTFTGFSWGYSGEGPRGLAEALELWGVELPTGNLPIDKYGKTDCSWSKSGSFSQV